MATHKEITKPFLFSELPDNGKTKTNYSGKQQAEHDQSHPFRCIAKKDQRDNRYQNRQQ